MTFTRHGHHIPGTTKDDEAPNRKKARCKGPGGYGSCYLCREDVIWHERDLEESEKIKSEALWQPLDEFNHAPNAIFYCVCGMPVQLYFNGGELDQDDCKCGRTYRARHVLTIIEVKEPNA